MRTAAVLSFSGFLFLFAALALPTETPPDHGREVYAMQKCALCHSIGGIGGKKAPLDGVGSRLKPDEIRKWIKTPKEMKATTTMKSYPNLPDRDLNDLVIFLTGMK
jgi:mono/diheme cytochrome c family protein